MLAKSISLIFSLLVVIAAAIWWAEPLTDAQHVVFHDLIHVGLGLAMLCFVISEFTKNYSQVDRIWSLAPILYAVMVAYAFGFPERTVLILVLITIWGLRLTYNFARTGAYKWPPWHAHEDYRWKVLQEKPEFQNRWIWRLFNLGFISIYQNGLILYFTLPILLVEDSPLTIWDYMLFGFLILVLVFETVADQQQWQFQQAKKIGDPRCAKGFVDTGLWAYSRHPNYLAEQTFWIGIYLFSIIDGHWINWTIGGCLLLIVLFRGSSDFSESISEGKYPAYSRYKKEVPRFLPFTKW